MYKMIAFTADGERLTPQYANNPAYFDRFKNRVNYKIVIMKKVKNRYTVIYSEL